MRRLVFVSISILVLLLGPISENMAKEPNDLSTILNRTRQLISEGKITEALELLQEVGKRIDIMETENLKMQEEFLWERAMHHLDFSNKLTNRDQYIAYATLAHEYWRDYINWYDRLFISDLIVTPSLPMNPSYRLDLGFIYVRG